MDRKGMERGPKDTAKREGWFWFWALLFAIGYLIALAVF